MSDASVRSDLPDELRRDVRLLSTMLGHVLVESGGQGLLDDVERLRLLAIDSDVPAAEEFVTSLAPERAEDVAKAFTCYFHLANLAEERHRVRVLTARDREQTDDVPGAWAGAWSRLRDELGEAAATERITDLEFRPVFTAHPTEARRRAVATTIRRLADLLDRFDDPRIGGSLQAELERQLQAEVDVLWRTAPLRPEKPTPLDEVRTAMSIFDETLFAVVPQVYRALDRALQGEQTGVAAPIARPFLRLGSWIGGDRDGNPNVTSRLTREASRIASFHALLGLERATTRIGRALTLSEQTTPPSPALLRLLRDQAMLAEEVAADIAERSPGEPHRRAVLFMAERLHASRRRDADLAYGSAEEFLADLGVLQESLLAGGDVRSAYGEVQGLIWQAETFGFHATELEVRQHSKVHREALAELDAGAEPSPMTLEVLDTIRAVRLIQQRHGRRAAGRYVISFTQSAEDIEAVFRLAAHAFPDGDGPVLDVIPLFETYDDLQASTDILTGMVASEPVRRRLAETGRRLEVMLGYSDSSKDVGPVSATLALHEAQARIADWAEENDLELTLFHGRGGALGRGGGPANQAVLAQPPGSVDGRFKLTEQGEVIFARYGDSTIARRHIEQVGSATLVQSLDSVGRRNAEAAARFAGLAATMDDSSRRRFYELVKADGFAPWFAQVTPQEEVGWLALGSRPAKRGLSVESLEDLRAIPWVFAWTQARINLTGWFGLGTALAAVGDETLLRQAYAEWPLFRAMIDNVEMSLAKTDDRIAARYLALGDRADLAALVTDEMELTRHWVQVATGGDRLLADRPVLRRAVELRSPYVDALSLLQLRALRRLRQIENDDPEFDSLRRLMLLSVSGVAAGLQNTG